MKKRKSAPSKSSKKAAKLNEVAINKALEAALDAKKKAKKKWIKAVRQLNELSKQWQNEYKAAKKEITDLRKAKAKATQRKTKAKKAKKPRNTKSKVKLKKKKSSGTSSKASRPAKSAVKSASPPPKAKLRKTASTSSRPKTRSTAPARSRADNFRRIEGIGPKIEQHIKAAGIKTYKQLGETRIATLRTILKKAGPRYNTHDPAGWAQQARYAAAGQWDKLKAHQEKLKNRKKS